MAEALQRQQRKMQDSVVSEEELAKIYNHMYKYESTRKPKKKVESISDEDRLKLAIDGVVKDVKMLI